MNNPIVKTLVYFVLALAFVLSAVFLSSWLEGRKTTQVADAPVSVTCPNDLDSFASTT